MDLVSLIGLAFTLFVMMRLLLSSWLAGLEMRLSSFLMSSVIFLRISTDVCFFMSVKIWTWSPLEAFGETSLSSSELALGK